jgi:hypothetical protein
VRLVKRRYKPSEDKTPFERIAEGQRIDYNFVKPHMGLEGKTPADASGIKLEGENNRWMALLRNARARQAK